MTQLPIDEFLPQILSSLASHRNLILVAEPGAGKTTRVPPAIVKANLLDAKNPNLVMLQPRRVAARAAAMRIAQENKWTIGEQVGWHVRFDRHITARTRLRVLTEGILTRQLLDDPFLESIGAVVLDEFHERSIHSDLTIALLREVQQTVRDDLRIIVMSATLDAEPIAKYLGDCPIIRVPGKTFPVEIEHAAIASNAPLPNRIESVLQREMNQIDGDVLIFLPGVAEIDRTARQVSSLGLRVMPLHGSLPFEQQAAVLETGGGRKIILATNIAETSLTVPGVKLVIDSGLARIASYDPQRGLDRLDLQNISKASAIQRAGRAGRTSPGKCVRLFTSREYHELADFELPQIHRIDLTGTVLSLHAWGKPDVRNFGWFDAPPESAIESAERLLTALGAIENGALTKLGKQMAALPVHPRLGRLLIESAAIGKIEDGAAIAALLSEKDILRSERTGDRSPSTQGESDILLRLDLLREAERNHFNLPQVDAISARQVVRLRDDLLRVARGLRLGKSRDASLLKLPLVAYPDRVCRRRSVEHATMVGGGGVKLAPESIVRQHEFFVALDARRDDRSNAREAVVRIASAIEVEWLGELFPHAIFQKRDLEFDADRQRVIARGVKRYFDLVLEEDADAPVDRELAGEVLAAALSGKPREFFLANEAAASWLARIDLLRRAMSEIKFPEFDDAALAEILREMCEGKRSVAELENVSAIPFFESRLEYAQRRILAEQAPETITVPSGNQIKLQYVMGQPPVLAARLQELFGWVDTPRVAGGRVSVVVHLLGPNYRPVQITNDLKSFWATTYFQVRKDLRVRYPKHSWPDDPLSAVATARGGRRK